MSKHIKGKSKSNKSKDQFKFDSRQTKFIGKRSGKFFQYMDPSKSKYGIMTQFNNDQIDEQNNLKNSFQKESNLTILNDQTQLKIKENINSIFCKRLKQPEKLQQSNLQAKNNLNKHLDLIICKETIKDEKQQAYKNQIEDKNQKINRIKQTTQTYTEAQQIQQRNKQQKQFKLKNQYQLKQKQNESFQSFVLQINEDQFKRQRQQDYFIVSNQLEDQTFANQTQTCQINIQNQKQLPSQPNHIQQQKQDQFRCTDQRNKKIKKKLLIKPENKKQVRKQHKKSSKMLTQILRIERKNVISCEAIKLLNKKKTSGIITFLPNTKVYFRGYTNEYDQLIIKCTSKFFAVSQQIILYYLESKNNFKAPHIIQSDIPFIIENNCKNSISLSFTLFKDQDESLNKGFQSQIQQ